MVFCSLRFLFCATVWHICICRYSGRADLLSKNETDFHFCVCFLKSDTQVGQTFCQKMKSMFNFTCVFECGHPGRYGFLQSSIFVLYNSIAHSTLPLPRSGRPSVKKTNGLSLLHLPFEIGQPGRADLPSKNEVDVQLYVCF